MVCPPRHLILCSRPLRNGYPMRLPFFYGWVVVAVAFVTMGVGVNARTAFSLLFPPILDEFGWERGVTAGAFSRSEEHTSELQSRVDLVCRLLLEKKNTIRDCNTSGTLE